MAEYIDNILLIIKERYLTQIIIFLLVCAVSLFLVKRKYPAYMFLAEFLLMAIAFAGGMYALWDIVTSDTRIKTPGAAG
ncbi:hypothetical protein [Paenibacillus silviterrae]|uniref:hypothetical protein n=1 Tax=Paenibacillus silviterrae TaxID=3242194 RepID=UPI0025437538|nr:hypothetical protein [Paenibacillus chinjuensis]